MCWDRDEGNPDILDKSSNYWILYSCIPKSNKIPLYVNIDYYWNTLSLPARNPINSSNCVI